MILATLSLHGMAGGYVVAWLAFMTGVCVWRTCVAEDHGDEAPVAADRAERTRESADRLGLTPEADGNGPWEELSRMALLDAMDGEKLPRRDELGWPGHLMFD